MIGLGRNEIILLASAAASTAQNTNGICASYPSVVFFLTPLYWLLPPKQEREEKQRRIEREGRGQEPCFINEVIVYDLKDVVYDDLNSFHINLELRSYDTTSNRSFIYDLLLRGS